MSSKSPQSTLKPSKRSEDDISSESSDDEMILAQNAGWDEDDSDSEDEGTVSG